MLGGFAVVLINYMCLKVQNYIRSIKCSKETNLYILHSSIQRNWEKNSFHLHKSIIIMVFMIDNLYFWLSLFHPPITGQVLGSHISWYFGALWCIFSNSSSILDQFKVFRWKSVMENNTHCLTTFLSRILTSPIPINLFLFCFFLIWDWFCIPTINNQWFYYSLK